MRIVALDPLLRVLLFTDGTVTRALEAHTLAPVHVEVIEQGTRSLGSVGARHLGADLPARCVRRRVAMRTTGGPLAVWAESHILPERLPATFVSGLASAPQGIGASIQGLQLESRRELLWYGLGSPPEWAPHIPAPCAALIRLYRVITAERPALLIREAFAVEQQAGRYRLQLAAARQSAAPAPTARHT